MEKPIRRIEVAESSRIDAVFDEAYEILDLALGIECFLLTDESRLCDFDPSPDEVERVGLMVGHPVDRGTPIVDLAEEYARR